MTRIINKKNAHGLLWIAAGVGFELMAKYEVSSDPSVQGLLIAIGIILLLLGLVILLNKRKKHGRALNIQEGIALDANVQTYGIGDLWGSRAKTLPPEWIYETDLSSHGNTAKA